MLQQILSTEFPPRVRRSGTSSPGWGSVRLLLKPINLSVKLCAPCKAESKNWDTTENLYIEGDNLEVLKLLQESYFGQGKK